VGHGTFLISVESESVDGGLDPLHRSLLIVYIFSQRWVISGVTRGSIK